MYKTVFVIVSVILLQGCSGSSIKQAKPADVTSSPSGAMVFASGVELGKTPLHFDLYDAFPGGWTGMTYHAQGVFMVKKDGCESYAVNVDDNYLSKPIHVELKCNEIKSTEKTITTEALAKSTERRLEELDALYKKGVITQDEYKANRARILNEL